MACAAEEGSGASSQETRRQREKANQLEALKLVAGPGAAVGVAAGAGRRWAPTAAWRAAVGWVTVATAEAAPVALAVEVVAVAVVGTEMAVVGTDAEEAETDAEEAETATATVAG